ncbi:MAG: hypothetical protein U5K81_05820 [Trueperaceae bacterium]|nr:hypothetical protein [Trueperaceae bacterium]
MWPFEARSYLGARWWTPAVAAALFVGVAGCLPLPDARTNTPPLQATMRVSPASVPSRAVWVPGASVPGTPEDMNGTTTLRFQLAEPADTIYVAVPGLFGGASAFAPLARRLVASQPGTQVWALDRRANALEDREPVRRALAASDPAPAVAAYLGTGDAPPTFLPPRPETHRFVAAWDLDVHLRDLHAVVREARASAERVVLLGHSMGASLAGVYVAWRSPDGLGHAQVDGLVLVDGAPGRTGAYGRGRDVRFAGVRLLPTEEAVRSGEAAPWVTLGKGGAQFAERQAAAVLAALAPEEDAPAHVRPFALTNLAYGGLMHDDQYGPLNQFYASIGEVQGAELDGNLAAFLVGGPVAARSASVVGVAAGEERVGWRPGDPRFERSDAQELFAAWNDPRADVAEWYVPVELLRDLAALSPDLTDQDAFVPMREVPLPTLAIGSDRGLLRSHGAFEAYAEQRLGSSLSVTILRGLTHMDLLTARDAPVVALVARWASRLPD